MLRTSARVAMLLLVGALGALGSGRAAAQATDAGPIVVGERYTFHSDILGEDRQIQLYTPPSFSGSGDSLPVLVVLDGGDQFEHTVGIVQFLARNNRMPEALVVGIPNPDQATRTRDLAPAAPSDTTGRWPTAGGADRFLTFLDRELRPWLERRFRAGPYRVLVGHSFGGLFAVHTLLREPRAFQAYLAVSPSLWWDDQAEAKRARQVLSPDGDGPVAKLWMTMGGEETGIMFAGAWGMTSVLETQAPKTLEWSWKPLPGEDHNSSPHRSIYDGLEWIFRDWRLPDLTALVMDGGDAGLERIDRHYDTLSVRYGFTIRPPRSPMIRAGYFLLGQGRTDDAVRVQESNVGRYPEAPAAWSAAGDAYRAACRIDDAHRAYDRAVALARTQDDPALETYLGKLDQLDAGAGEAERCRGGGGADRPRVRPSSRVTTPRRSPRP